MAAVASRQSARYSLFPKPDKVPSEGRDRNSRYERSRSVTPTGQRASSLAPAAPVIHRTNSTRSVQQPTLKLQTDLSQIQKSKSAANSARVSPTKKEEDECALATPLTEANLRTIERSYKDFDRTTPIRDDPKSFSRRRPSHPEHSNDAGSPSLYSPPTPAMERPRTIVSVSAEGQKVPQHLKGPPRSHPPTAPLPDVPPRNPARLRNSASSSVQSPVEGPAVPRKMGDGVSMAVTSPGTAKSARSIGTARNDSTSTLESATSSISKSTAPTTPEDQCDQVFPSIFSLSPPSVCSSPVTYPSIPKRLSSATTASMSSTSTYTSPPRRNQSQRSGVTTLVGSGANSAVGGLQRSSTRTSNTTSSSRHTDRTNRTGTTASTVVSGTVTASPSTTTSRTPLIPAHRSVQRSNPPPASSASHSAVSPPRQGRQHLMSPLSPVVESPRSIRHPPMPTSSSITLVASAQSKLVPQSSPSSVYSPTLSNTANLSHDQNSPRQYTSLFPAYNPNVSLQAQDYRPAFRPHPPKSNTTSPNIILDTPTLTTRPSLDFTTYSSTAQSTARPSLDVPNRPSTSHSHHQYTARTSTEDTAVERDTSFESPRFAPPPRRAVSTSRLRNASQPRDSKTNKLRKKRSTTPTPSIAPDDSVSLMNHHQPQSRGRTSQSKLSPIMTTVDSPKSALVAGKKDLSVEISTAEISAFEPWSPYQPPDKHVSNGISVALGAIAFVAGVGVEVARGVGDGVRPGRRGRKGSVGHKRE